MSLLQLQNSLRNPRSVIALSCILHVVACFALLFIYKDYHQRLFIDLSSRISSQAVVKLLPLSASRSAIVEGKKGAGSGVATSVQKKKSKAPTMVLKQRVAKKQASGSKKGAKKKGKNVLQEKKQTKVKEKDKTKSAVPEQKVVEKPKVEEPVSAKKEEVSAVESPKVEEQTAVAVEVPEQPRQGQEIVYLTQQELDALQIHQKLQESIFSVWEAPIGMAAEQYCEVMVAIGWDGAVQETQFLKKTGSLVYDLSVQETVEQVIFPHEVWGKRITIAFKP